MRTLLFILCVTYSLSLKAQEAKFNVDISRDSVLLGNYITVTFSVENGKVDDFLAPTFADFNVVGGPSTSSSISIVNGVTSQSMKYTYYIEPKEEGLFYIEPASVKIDGQFLETSPIAIKVAPNPEGLIQSPKQQKSRTFDSIFEDPFFHNPFFDRTEPRQPEHKTKGKIKRKYYKI